MIERIEDGPDVNKANVHQCTISYYALSRQWTVFSSLKLV